MPLSSLCLTVGINAISQPTPIYWLECTAPHKDGGVYLFGMTSHIPRQGARTSERLRTEAVGYDHPARSGGAGADDKHTCVLGPLNRAVRMPRCDDADTDYRGVSTCKHSSPSFDAAEPQCAGHLSRLSCEGRRC